MNKPLSIALFGGSFDPIHLGHVGLLEAASSSLGIDEIHLIPCKQSPHKENTPLASDQQRLEMCQLATAHIPSVHVSDLEVTRDTPSYSWMTVEHYQKQYPNASLYWIMGTDQWDTLEHWSKAEFLKESLTFIVIERQHPVQSKDGFRYQTVSFNHEISATEIRNNLKSNHSVSDMLPPAVLEFIEKYGLYR